MKPAVQQTLTDALRNAETADAQGIAIVMLGAEPGMIMSVVAADVPEQGCRDLARALRRLADRIDPTSREHLAEALRMATEAQAVCEEIGKVLRDTCTQEMEDNLK